MRSVSPVLARRAISRNEKKREHRAFGVEFFSSSREEVERRRSREKKDGEKRSKPTHLECKSAGKKNKLGGSNNKEICFSSNTHRHTYTQSQDPTPLPPRRLPSLPHSFFKRIHTRTLPHAHKSERTFELYLLRYVLRDPVLSHVIRQLLLPSV